MTEERQKDQKHTLTTRLRIWAKHRTRVLLPGNEGMRSASSLIMVSLFEALSPTTARIWGCVSNSRIGSRRCLPCPESHTHASIRRCEMQGRCQYGIWRPCHTHMRFKEQRIERSTHLTKSRIMDSIVPSRMKVIVIPRNEITCGEVQPSTHICRRPA